MTVSYGNGAKGKASRLWARIIRCVGICARCDGSPVQACHIIGRRYAWTRTNLDNGVALCARCHHWFGDHPVEFARFAIDRIGRRTYNQLFRLSERRERFDWPAEVARLEAVAAELGL